MLKQIGTAFVDQVVGMGVFLHLSVVWR